MNFLYCLTPNGRAGNYLRLLFTQKGKFTLEYYINQSCFAFKL